MKKKTAARNFQAKNWPSPAAMAQSIERRDAAAVGDGGALESSVNAASAQSCNCRATRSGEIFAIGWPASRDAAYSLMVAKSCGSSGLTLPKTFGDGVSV